MQLKLVTAVSALLAIPALVHAQQDGPSLDVPKLTKADIQEVAQIITNNKAKLRIFCELNEYENQQHEAEQKNDGKTVEALEALRNALIDELGPEYSKVTAGQGQFDENSTERKEFTSTFDEVKKLCTK
jgi:hypothetical protein